ncbi:DUF1153 domain-containing protein [Novosphingobium sp. 9U]|uniref:DUF1153 domain-containing protein n=1 Tax=Novosphingobium sp. 9U TaxID=2653158 RepID=UPI00135724D0|nr:DUF1153 domain-containing protein [Novosphingobium sp. 9U]
MARKLGANYEDARVIERSIPLPDTSRWVAKRKADVVAAIERGAISMNDACERYQLSHHELTSWRRAVRRKGAAALPANNNEHERLKRQG